MDEQELKYWMEEYPELDEEDIVAILEAVGMEEESESSTRYSDYINPPAEKPSGLKGVLKKIIDPDH